MGSFLDKIMTISLEKSRGNREKEVKTIKKDVDKYYGKAQTVIEKAANKGAFYTMLTITNNEHGCEIAELLVQKLIEEGFSANVNHCPTKSEINVHWHPYTYQTKREIGTGRFTRTKVLLKKVISF